MNVEPEDLRRLANFAEKVRAETWRLSKDYGRDRPDLDARLYSLREAAAGVAVTLRDRYGASPGNGASRPPDVPLELLDTPANRRLARILEEAVEAAKAVDRERGYGDDGPAGVLEMYAEQVRTEVHGPAGVSE